jgi:2-oxoisovalerate dehydrogenase E1 component
MALRVARRLQTEYEISVRVLDLRWIKPLDRDAILSAAADCEAVVVFDEGRPEGGVGESVVSLLAEQCDGRGCVRRVTSADCYIPLGDAANLILASEQDLVDACLSVVS